MLFLVISNNSIAGPLPNFPNTTPKLKRLELVNNHLTGTVHDNIFKLGDLSVLALTGNKLSGGNPAWIGNLTQLTMLRLLSNLLGLSIPVRIGKLQCRRFLVSISCIYFDQSVWDKIQCCLYFCYSAVALLLHSSDALKVLDLSSNTLTGIISFELSMFQGTIDLRGNVNL